MESAYARATPARGGARRMSTRAERTAPRTVSVAQSLQEPRTLDNFREIFGRGNRSGYLEINRVMRGSSPHHAQWRRKYVVLEDGVVFAADHADDELERLVTIEEVNSVKTARSLESDTIISLSTPGECFYMHTADDAEMKDWLLCFHTTVINILLKDHPHGLLSGSTRHMVAGRSQSGDMDDQPALWASAEGDGTLGLARYGHSDLGGLGPPPLASLPTVDQFAGNTLHKSATRDFSVPVSLSTSPRDYPTEIRRASAVAAPMDRTMLQVDSMLSGLPPPAPATSPSRMPTATSGRRTSFRATMGPAVTESTKRVTEPPVEMDGAGYDLSSSFSSNSSNGHQSNFHHQRHHHHHHHQAQTHEHDHHHHPRNFQFQDSDDDSAGVDSKGEAQMRHDNELTRSDAAAHWGVAPYSHPSSSSPSSTSSGGPSGAAVSGAGPFIAQPVLESGGTLGSAARGTGAAQRDVGAPIAGRSKGELAAVLAASSSPASTAGGDEPPKPKSKYVPPHLRGKPAGAEDDEDQASDMPPMEVHPYLSGDEDGPYLASPRAHALSLEHNSRMGGSGGGMLDDGGLFAMESGTGNGRDRVGSELSGLSEAEGARQAFGRRAEQGCRATMEDFDVALPRLEENKSLGFFAVYDGHCGTRVAELASKQLHEYARAHESIYTDWPRGAETATFDAFARIEREFFELATSREQPLRDGTCAIVLLVHYSDPDSTHADGVAVANLGDSRAVLFNQGYVTDLSVEHSPARPDERERIESVGGWVTVEREMLIEKLHRVDLDDPFIRDRVTRRFNYVETSRVNGELAVSRALGDIDYKKPAQDEYQWFFPSNHEASGQSSFEFGADLVNSTPEWKHLQLEDHATSEAALGSKTLPLEGDFAKGPFVVLACDGLWDAINSEEAIEYCRSCKSPQQASDRLVEVALRMGTSDNVTALVVPLAPDAFSRNK